MTFVIKTISTIEHLKDFHLLCNSVFGLKNRKSASDKHLKELLTKDGFHALGAFIDGNLVGGLTAYELVLVSGKKELYIYDIAVSPKHQRKNIGTMLIQELIKIAKSLGVDTIFVEAEADDKGAVKFYQSLKAEEISVKHFNINIKKVV